MWKIRFGRCIYQSGKGAQIFQNFFFRWLKLDGRAFQTVLNRYFPHRPALNYIKALILPVQLKPADCCMLGLGGAGAAHALASFMGQFKITAVENNEEVINLASRFFMLDSLTNLTVIHDDANNFIAQSTQLFTYLLVDLFDAQSFPKQCNNSDFFRHCKRVLLPEGILALNLANQHEHRPIFQLIQEHFPQSTVVIPIKGCANLIILACNTSNMSPFLDTFKKNCKELYWDPQWGYLARLG